MRRKQILAPPIPRLARLETNPTGAIGRALWAAHRKRIAHLYDLSLPGRGGTARFHCNTILYQTAHALLMQTQAAAQTMHRGAEHIAKGADEVLLYLQVEGRLRCEVPGRSLRLAPGDVAIFDYTQPIDSEVSDYTILVLSVARSVLPPVFTGEGLHGRVLPGDTGAGALVGGALRTLFARGESLTVIEGEAAIAGILTLTAHLVGAAIQAEAGEAGGIDDVQRRERALAYVDRHLGAPDLAASEMADHLGISVASLYRLFEGRGTVGGLIQERRLDHCLRLMLTEADVRGQLAKLAERHGFGGPSQFSRAFRQRYGQSPRAYVGLMRRQDRAWHEAQLARVNLTIAKPGLTGSEPVIETGSVPDAMASDLAYSAASASTIRTAAPRRLRSHPFAT